jgi:ABC-type transport system involved in multi-copper enzyme maturation permease subunit
VRAVLLIAMNFIREQRWPILVLLVWVLLLDVLGLSTDLHRNREDLLFIFKQIGIYVVAFSVFFGGSAIYNERKTRRILAVLSKSVARKQYLSGLVTGVTGASAIYCFTLGITGSWTLTPGGFPVSHLWFLMLSLVCACMLAGTVALMFSTFLNPFLAAGSTAAVLGLPALAARLWTEQWGYVIPVYPLSMNLVNATFDSPGRIAWKPVGLAILETLFFWIVSAQIFSHVDIAVAVE